MNKVRKQRQIMQSVIIGLILHVNIAETANAQSSKPNAESVEQSIAERQFSHKVGKIVLKAQEFIGEAQYGSAIAELNKALALAEVSPYERGVINQLRGNCYYEGGKYTDAINAFEAAIKSGGLLPAERSALRVNIAQLHIANGQPAHGAEMLENWNQSGGELSPKYIEMLWQAWLQAEQYDRALPWVEKWFAGVPQKERRHYDVLNFLYGQLQMLPEQEDTIKHMLIKWPEEKQLWEVWISLLANNGHEDDAFAASKILYIVGAYTTESELVKIIQYYSFYGMPYQAAQILERGMEAGYIQTSPDKLVQLSNLYRQAREYKRAIPILEMAAKAAGTGKIYADLGEALYKESLCPEAELAFKKAMALGYDQGKSWTLIGACYYDASADDSRLSCNMSSAQIKSAPWTVKRKLALEAYENVQSISAQSGDANTWKQFINAESKAVERRCGFGEDVRREQCYLAIRQAYSNTIFIGEFKVDDENCIAHKDTYDAKYRTGW